MASRDTIFSPAKGVFLGDRIANISDKVNSKKIEIENDLGRSIPIKGKWKATVYKGEDDEYFIGHFYQKTKFKFLRTPIKYDNMRVLKRKARKASQNQ
ncbi:MAG: hypothetical protein R8P61_01940 [Bacteroidia bacterium]|nr:hypothetical protein [Bacteroidia bacterium]